MAEVQLDLRILAIARQFNGVPKDKLVAWIRERRVTGRDQVSPVGTNKWRTVAQVSWLAAHLPAEPSGEPELVEDEPLDEEFDSGWVISKKRRKHDEAEIDMTPMIDVTFQLLIFFMLTNSLTNPAPIAVPEAVHGVGISPDGHQMLLVDQDGQVYLGDKIDPAMLVGLDDIASRVQTNVGAAGSLDVIVSAHKQAKHSAVRKLIEQLGGVPGLGQITLGIEEKRQ